MPRDAAGTHPLRGGPSTVTLVLHAHLARYAGGRERVELPYRPAATLRAYVESVAIPAHEYYAVIRRGVASRELDAVPDPGETVELLPAMSGG